MIPSTDPLCDLEAWITRSLFLLNPSTSASLRFHSPLPSKFLGWTSSFGDRTPLVTHSFLHLEASLGCEQVVEQDFRGYICCGIKLLHPLSYGSCTFESLPQTWGIPVCTTSTFPELSQAGIQQEATGIFRYHKISFLITLNPLDHIYFHTCFKHSCTIF